MQYEKYINGLREKEYQDSLADPLDWLNLVGLFWLEEDENSIGNDESNKIFLPAFPAPFCGKFNFKNGIITFKPAKGISFTGNHPNPETRPLITDAEKEPDLITIGSLTMKIIVRGPATLVRVWDQESPLKKDFTGYKYYPINKDYVVNAKYVRYDPPKKIPRVDMIGTETEGFLLGQAQFTLNGVNSTLEAEKDGEKLLFHFVDETSKITTYGGGRKFRVPSPENDEVILDFNLTENWPCAYTSFATCPMVLKENRLPIKIEAGEKKLFEDH